MRSEFTLESDDVKPEEKSMDESNNGDIVQITEDSDEEYDAMFDKMRKLDD